MSSARPLLESFILQHVYLVGNVVSSCTNKPVNHQYWIVCTAKFGKGVWRNKLSSLYNRWNIIMVHKLLFLSVNLWLPPPHTKKTLSRTQYIHIVGRGWEILFCSFLLVSDVNCKKGHKWPKFLFLELNKSINLVIWLFKAFSEST